MPLCVGMNARTTPKLTAEAETRPPCIEGVGALHSLQASTELIPIHLAPGGRHGPLVDTRDMESRQCVHLQHLHRHQLQLLS